MLLEGLWSLLLFCLPGILEQVIEPFCDVVSALPALSSHSDAELCPRGPRGCLNSAQGWGVEAEQSLIPPQQCHRGRWDTLIISWGLLLHPQQLCVSGLAHLPPNLHTADCTAFIVPLLEPGD